MEKLRLSVCLCLPVLTTLTFVACSDGADPAGTSNTANSSATGATSTSDGTTTSGASGTPVTSGASSTVTTGTTGSTTGTTGAASTTGAGGGATTASTTQGATTGSTSSGGAGSTTDAGSSTTGGVMAAEGPCDLYAADGTPCVAAYSMVRRIVSGYDGPLYQVRSGSNAMNTGTGGETHDIGFTADGFGDAAAQDAVCAGTICTISILYDQSGRGNDIIPGLAGNSAGGEWADDDDFESIADAGPITVAGHNVYSLYMDTRQGYRQRQVGDGMPRGTESQGIYMLADGTHYGTACCWDFGNVTHTPADGWHFMDTLFFGVAYWGRGAGSGPWFMADFEAGVWAGGSNPSDPGWGSLDTTAPPNMNNPSLGVPFAIGFLKVSSDYSLRMADLQAANSLTTAYQGPMPKAVDHQGAVVLGVGGDNSNNSWGTFFEGAIVAGYPSDEVEDAVMQNVKAVGYF